MNRFIELRDRVLVFAALVWPTFAQAAVPVPEPESWSLVALALVGVAIVTLRNRRK